MSYDDLNLTKKQLLRAAELTETHVKTSDNKDEIVAALEKNGVDSEHYEAFIAPQIAEEEKLAEAKQPKPAENVVTSDDVNQNIEEPVEETVEATKEEPAPELNLVRYIGHSTHFERYGKVWSVNHPYVPIEDEEVLDQISRDRLFRVASKREVLEFYS